MSREGAPTFSQNAKGSKVAIIASAWHNEIMDQLIYGAKEALTKAEVNYEVFRVAGAFEIPLASRVALDNFDAVVALGVVIRGDTPHFEYVCDAVTSGISQIILQTLKPIGFGLLTVDNEQQAKDRSSIPYAGDNKGVEAAEAVIASLDVLKQIRKQTLRMKSFDNLWSELNEKVQSKDPSSSTVSHVSSGVHEVGKKVVEEAAEAWMACEFESEERAAEEISQLVYQIQALMLARGIKLEDVYRKL